ncbi:MAG TPA: tRNA (adenosine(37)-N6)-threonylcarbamoyltransferase complex ATPase subunit type 1 TsaE [Pseudobdellovibrionaceae bacterium]|nr:tRNA (adenosine(37)-N6)-threonylcarbamoyltransferase complex ATPase subunit type 1 TsaE [Pseudobdellovibrionaceae bacterium]
MNPPFQVSEITAANLAEFKSQASAWAKSQLQVSQPKLVFLEGAMGSGKTTWVTAVAETFGAQEAASPSFALHSEYGSKLAQLDHLDLDRLDSRDELESVGLWDLLAERRTQGATRFILIEWANRLVELGLVKDLAECARTFSGFQVWRIELTVDAATELRRIRLWQVGPQN